MENKNFMTVDPVWLSMTIILLVSGIGFMMTFLYFKNEDLK